MVTKPALVLVVEDELLIRMLVADTLEEAGFQVLEASHAEEALELLERKGVSPSVLATDINLGPGMDGIALAAEMRRRLPKLPVVFITGNPDRLTGKSLGPPERLVPKPFLPSTLTDVIASMV